MDFNIEDLFPASQPQRSLRRRSSVAHSIRRSQSGGGISFEDQISSINSQDPLTERLSQVFQLSLSATVRQVQKQYEEVSNESVQNLVDHVKSGFLLSGPLLPSDHPLISKLSEQLVILSGLAKESSSSVSAKQLPPRLRSLQEYMAQVSEESNQWKDLNSSRKNRLNSNRSYLKQVLKGEALVEESTRADLPRAEDAGLRSASDGRLELERLKQQSCKLVTARNQLKLHLAKRRHTLDELSREVDRSAKLICLESGAQFGVDPLNDIPKIMGQRENSMKQN